MLFIGVAVLVIAWALHIAWIAKLAEARGRSVVLWILIGIVAAAVGARIGVWIMDVTSDSDNDVAMLFGSIAPLPILMLAMGTVAFVVSRLPVRVQIRREWPVHSSAHGPGSMLISRDSLVLQWANRSDTILRAEVKNATVDGECLRLGSPTGELLLMPMGTPQTRAGRISQAKTLARILATPT